MIEEQQRNGLLWGIFAVLGVTLAVLFILAGCREEEAPAPTAVIEPTPTPAPLNPLSAAEMNQSFPSPAYGIHLAQWWDLGALQRDMALVNEMEFGWVKQNFAWRDIEGHVKGEYDWYRPDEIVNAANDAGLNLIVRIDRHPLWSVRVLPDEQITPNQPPVELQDFGDFCRVLAERYKGRIQAYQVWNEPNLSREWGNKSPDPAEYAARLKVCDEGIKAADPDAVVISAGLAPTGTEPPLAMPDDRFLQGMYDAGASAYFDVLGLHAPGYKAPPEVSPDEIANLPEYGQYRWHVFRHVEDMRRMMVANGDAQKQIAILEMGWTTDTRPSDYAWHAVTQEEQADYLVRAYQYAQENWSPWIGVMTTIYFSDVAWTEEDEQFWWALTEPDGTARPAAYALQEMDKQRE